METTTEDLVPEVKIFEKNKTSVFFPGWIVWLVNNPDFLPLNFSLGRTEESWHCLMETVLVSYIRDRKCFEGSLRFKLVSLREASFVELNYKVTLEIVNGVLRKITLLEEAYQKEESPSQGFITIASSRFPNHRPETTLVFDPRPVIATPIDELRYLQELERALLRALQPQSF